MTFGIQMFEVMTFRIQMFAVMTFGIQMFGVMTESNVWSGQVRCALPPTSLQCNPVQPVS